LKACGGRVFVEDALVIDAPTDADCVWEIETETDRILAISAVRGENLEQFVTVRIISFIAYISVDDSNELTARFVTD